MTTLLIDNTTKHLDELAHLLADYQIDTKPYYSLTENDLVRYDSFILSGGSSFPATSDFHDLTLEKQLISTTNKPVVGICFGFELIAHVFGSTLKRIETKRKGIIPLTKLHDDPIFSGLKDIQVYEAHRYVVDKLGNELIPLASSVDGIEIIRHQYHPIYGVQFHPEVFPSRTQGDEIFANIFRQLSSV